MNEKRRSHKDQLLALMRDGRWYHMQSLQHVGGWRYGARLHELKAEGWDHEKRSVGDDAFEYRLLVNVEEKQGVLAL